VQALGTTPDRVRIVFTELQPDELARGGRLVIDETPQ
jgi:phenylpyruvate tautomerase PptA (4-oxalocrotonate tautomerase family)